MADRCARCDLPFVDGEHLHCPRTPEGAEHRRLMVRRHQMGFGRDSGSPRTAEEWMEARMKTRSAQLKGGANG